MVARERVTHAGWVLSIFFTIVVGALLLSRPTHVSAASPADVQIDDVAVVVAKRAADLFVQGDFTSLHALFAPEIQAQLSADELEEGVQQFGPVIALGGPVPLPQQTNVAVAVVQFETITFDLLIAVEPPGWLIGFQLVPHHAANLGGQDVPVRPVDGRTPGADTENGVDSGTNVERVGPSSNEGNVDGEVPAYVDRDAFAEREVTFGLPGWELPGTYSYPTRLDRFSAVVLVHGSGPADRDETIGVNRPFRDLAWGLASRGIAVLRYDKRTLVHQFGLDPGSITPEQEVIDDALAAVEWLKAQPGVGPVYVVGHSLGGMLAPEISRRADGDVAGIVSLAGAARPLEDMVLEQLQYLAELDGGVSGEEAQQIADWGEAVAAIQSGAMPDETMLSGAPAGYYRALRELLPVPIAQRLDVPMLVMQGGRDYQVTETDFALWRQGLAGRPNVTFDWFPTLNHLFMTGGTPPSPDDYLEPGHVAPGVIEAVASFVDGSARITAAPGR